MLVVLTLSLHYAPAYRSAVDQCMSISRESGNASALLYLLPLVLLIGGVTAHNPLHRFFPLPDRWANYVLRVAATASSRSWPRMGLKTGALRGPRPGGGRIPAPLGRRLRRDGS